VDDWGAVPDERRVPIGTRALVITVSDGVAGGTRHDDSGDALAKRLEQLGFMPERLSVADDREAIRVALVSALDEHAFVVTTGGTGLTPRDVTPQATAAVLEYEVPGLAEVMRAEGRAKTPMADLSRGLVGVARQRLIANVPGSPRAALESLAALEPTLRHALETLAGPFDHGARTEARADLPTPDLPASGSGAPDPQPTDEQTSGLPVSSGPASPALDLAGAVGAGPSSGLLDFDREPAHDFGKPTTNDPWRDLPDEGRR
jgi:molybdopterin adenylyltransferase